MNCPYCGTEIPDGYDFCPIDGSRVNREPQDKDKHSWAKTLRLVVGLVFVLSVFVGVLSLIGGKFMEDDSTNADNLYEQADQLMQAGNFEEAARIFGELGDYEDAVERQQQALLSQAAQLMKSGNYTNATEILMEAGLVPYQADVTN